MPRPAGFLQTLAFTVLLTAGCVGSPSRPGSSSLSDAALPAEVEEAPSAPPRPIGFEPDAPPDLRRAPPFALGSGAVPVRDEALAFPNRYNSFTAKTDEGFAELAANGHLSGRGTSDDPYVLERFYVKRDLTLQSLHGALILREGYVEGQLRLNYVGEQVYIHHVYAGDLRINENIDRSATNTGGLLHDNRFAFVGQIRHFVGEFRENLVGPRPAGAIATYLGDAGVAEVEKDVVFNFDGFHRALVHNNTFHGQVDIKLHGHNHADCFTCPVHDHDDPSGFPDGAAHQEDGGHGYRSRHSVRYASLQFVDNDIYVEEDVALRYNDRNHAGDDRTANSEPNPFLEDDHVHYQDITFARNRLDGGSLRIDVFNAADERHAEQNQGILRIWDNEVIAAHGSDAFGSKRRVAAIDLSATDGLELSVRANALSFRARDAEGAGALVPALSPTPTLVGVLWREAEDGNGSLSHNVVASGDFGVYAVDFAPSVAWRMAHNEFHTTKAWQGERVSNPPEESP